MTENVLKLPVTGIGEVPTLRMPASTQEQPTSFREQQRDAAYYSYATDRDVRETLSFVQSNWSSNLRAEAQEASRAALTERTDEALQLEGEEVDEAIVSTITELQQVESLSRFLPDSMVSAIRADVTGSRAMAIDRIAKLQYAGDRFQETMEGFGVNGETVLDFAEIAFDPFSIFHLERYKRLTTEFQQLLRPDVSAEEYEEGLDRIITEALDTGLVSNENKFYFAAFLDTLGSGIYSSEVEAEAYLGWLDLGLTVLPIQGISAARNTTAITNGVVPRSAAMAPQDAARSATSGMTMLSPSSRRQSAINSHLDEAIILDDPSTLEAARSNGVGAVTPTTQRAGLYSAPEHEAIRTFELGSRAWEMFRHAAVDVADSPTGIYDEAAFAQFEEQFKVDRMSRLRELGRTRIHEIDVDVDEFNNIYAVEYYGRTDGRGFATEANARRSAEFSYGDDVQQMPDGTWSVVRRINIDPDDLEDLRELGYTGPVEQTMLYRATNVDELGSGFWARWGSPAAQADPETGGSYLYRSESVFERTMRELNKQTRRATRGMRPARQREVYEVFTWMAGEEATTALTEQGFRRWFFNNYERAPSDQQVQLYLLEQGRRDAQALANADIFYKRAVAMDAVAMRNGDVTYIVRQRTNLPDNTLVFDPFEEGGRVRPIRETDTVYENLSSTDLPGDALYIVGDQLESRAVRHSDFMARNAGVRDYELNWAQFMVSQPNVRTYAGGETRVAGPRTALGARTSEEAKDAAESINRIIDELDVRIPGNRLTKENFLDAIEAGSTRVLDDIVRANNRWNPEIESIQDLVNFARKRDLDLRPTAKFSVRAEGDKLEEMASLEDSAIYIPDNASYGDALKTELAFSGRGTGLLPQYGGGTVPTRGPEETLHGAIASTMARATETAYRLRAGQGLIKAALDAGVMKADYNKIRHLPLRAQLERIQKEGLIDVSGAKGKTDDIGKRLQLDLDRLLFRLDRESYTARRWNDMMRGLGNFFYKNFPNGKKFASWADRRSADPVTALRGFAFDAYLGFFNHTQFLMQSVQLVNIIGISPLRGIQGAALYPAMRFAYANGNPAVIRRTGELLEKVTGMPADQFVDMVDMFTTSGRGVVHSLAELTSFEDVQSNIGRFSKWTGLDTAARGVRRTREAGRFFFKEGDLVARITAYNTAYLEAVNKFGVRTAKNKAAFNRFVTDREQRLTQNMTGASRQAYEQIPFMQFMTYQLRINEAIFSGTFGGKSRKILTNRERISLAAAHLSMFGMMATGPTAYFAQWLMYNNDMDYDENLVRSVQRGGLDAILSYMTDSETAASDRYASSGVIYDTMRSLSQDKWWEFLIGPSGELTLNLSSTLAGAVTSSLAYIEHGNPQGLEASLEDFARTFSTTNYAYNAILASKYGIYRTRRGQNVTDQLTDTSDAVFLAFGIPLEEVSAAYEYIGQRSIHNGFLQSHADSITRSYRRWADAIARRDMEDVEYWGRMIADAYAVLEPHERARVERMVNDNPETLTDSLFIDMWRQQSEYLERTNN